MWDYPRPPRLERFDGPITIELGNEVIATTENAWRVLETSHPPTYYLPRTAFAQGVLREAPGTSWCEWKGQARYFDLVSSVKVAPKAAWTYPDPTPGFAPIADAVAVMAGDHTAELSRHRTLPRLWRFYCGSIPAVLTMSAIRRACSAT